MRFEPARSHGKAAAVREVGPELAKVLSRRRESEFAFPVMDWLTEPRASTKARFLAMDSRVIAARVLNKFVDLGGQWPAC